MQSHRSSQHPPEGNSPLKIVVLYLLGGLLWFALSAWLLQLVPDMPLLGSAFLNLLFLLISASLLMLVLRTRHQQLRGQRLRLLADEQRYRKLYEESPQPMWICSSQEKRLLSLNDAALALFGYTMAELRMKPLQQLVYEKDQYLLNLHLQPEQHYEKAGIWRFSDDKGEIVFLDLVIHQIQFNEHTAKLVIANNLTDLIRTEEEKLRIHNELHHYKKALDRSAMLTVTDLEGNIIDINSKVSEITGWSRHELLGQNPRVLSSGHHPKHFWTTMFHSLQHGQVWRGEVRNKTKEGQPFWIDMSVVPVYDEHNQIYKYMGMAYPITDRKMAEIRSEKIHRELMTFMYKASHNLRGPVATLSGLINVAKMEVQDPITNQYIKLMGERANHLEFTLSELIAITKVKQEDLSLAAIDFQALIDDVLLSFERSIRDGGISVDVAIRTTTPFSTDEKLIRGILFYLIDNSIKFRNNQNPRIRVAVDEQSNGVLMTVADNGPGIDPEIQDRIYDMYYRGHEKSQGSGLGLYIVASIVERLCGYITLDSSIHTNSGATFRIFLPNDLYLRRNLPEKDMLPLQSEN
ncbi:sensor histidine kinase [Cesiribacter andamanensis]|uniref:histidine kinase n=1 Tax=Cesiribacter andamanensis AMV16 TaxID=1279009 RepID=M7N6Y3_9BACT|nr:PAS domain-containing sensor histidine kinase [Cesiribacter andamanensis]EMR02996.1 Phytochrome-like protein cph1 [Cesiribacter andamanensis AMV16]